MESKNKYKAFSNAYYYMVLSVKPNFISPDILYYLHQLLNICFKTLLQEPMQQIAAAVPKVQNRSNPFCDAGAASIRKSHFIIECL